MTATPRRKRVKKTTTVTPTVQLVRSEPVTKEDHTFLIVFSVLFYLLGSVTTLNLF